MVHGTVAFAVTVQEADVGDADDDVPIAVPLPPWSSNATSHAIACDASAAAIDVPSVQPPKQPKPPRLPKPSLPQGRAPDNELVELEDGQVKLGMSSLPRLQLEAEKVDDKLWPGAAALGWKIVEAKSGTAAKGQWLYLAPASSTGTGTGAGAGAGAGGAGTTGGGEAGERSGGGGYEGIDGSSSEVVALPKASRARATFKNRATAIEHAQALGHYTPPPPNDPRRPKEPKTLKDRLELTADKVDDKLWPGAAAFGWKIVEARPGLAAKGQWLYLAPTGSGGSGACGDGMTGDGTADEAGGGGGEGGEIVAFKNRAMAVEHAQALGQYVAPPPKQSKRAKLPKQQRPDATAALDPSLIEDVDDYDGDDDGGDSVLLLGAVGFAGSVGAGGSSLAELDGGDDDDKAALRPPPAQPVRGVMPTLSDVVEIETAIDAFGTLAWVPSEVLYLRPRVASHTFHAMVGGDPELIEECTIENEGYKWRYASDDALPIARARLEAQRKYFLEGGQRGDQRGDERADRKQTPARASRAAAARAASERAAPARAASPSSSPAGQRVEERPTRRTKSGRVAVDYREMAAQEREVDRVLARAERYSMAELEEKKRKEEAKAARKAEREAEAKRLAEAEDDELLFGSPDQQQPSRGGRGRGAGGGGARRGGSRAGGRGSRGSRGGSGRSRGGGGARGRGGRKADGNIASEELTIGEAAVRNGSGSVGVGGGALQTPRRAPRRLRRSGGPLQATCR